MPGSPAQSSSSGVVGEAGRYQVSAPASPSFRIAGNDLALVGPLRMYACGITPYDVTHVGHAATFVWADLIRSLARAHGLESVVTRNVTDIDDVLTQAAQTRGVHYDELALTQEFLFDRDMRALSVAAPTSSPHARGFVPAVIRLAAALLEKGAAYESDGFVYFRGSDLPEVSLLGEHEALRLSSEYGDQVDVPGRESPFDVAVWRPSPPEHPAWPSPWGWGRPGWHAECAAMAMATLGSSVDVLVGGDDLAFPHHAYQAAMVEAASGVHPFARARAHVGEVCFDGVKMSKSLGNLVLVGELLERHRPAAVRLALLNRRWQDAWECEPEVFTRAEETLSRLESAAGERPAGDGKAVRPAEQVLALLRNELDVPACVELALEAGPDGTAGSVLDLLKLRPEA